MKLYIAHNFAARFDLRQEVERLTSHYGIEVTSRWILEVADCRRTQPRGPLKGHEDES